MIWANLKGHDHTEKNGTDVRGIGSENLLMRLGLRAYLENRRGQDKGKENFQPFIEANWAFNSQNNGVQMNNEQVGGDHIHNEMELKGSVEGELNHNLSVCQE